MRRMLHGIPLVSYNVFCHFVNILVSEIRKIYRHHFSVWKNHRHGNVDFFNNVKLTDLQHKLSNAQETSKGKDMFLNAVRSFMEMETLTAPLAKELIDHIDVYEAEKELFSNYTCAYNEFSSISNSDSFISGFRFGARFTYDTFVK